jgi:glycosyltransferase involved in cell wall biosynthesis
MAKIFSDKCGRELTTSEAIRARETKYKSCFNSVFHMFVYVQARAQSEGIGRRNRCTVVRVAVREGSPVVTEKAQVLALAEDGEKGSPSVLVVVAALDEEEGVGPTIAELRQFVAKPRILVVDGRSCDRTVDIAKGMGAEVICQEGEGKGDAIGSAIRHINGDADYVVFIDADYTYPASYLPTMVRILERNPRVGMVCGNRFNEHLDIRALHHLLYFGNRLLAFSHNILDGVKLTDPLTGLRTVRAQLLRGWKPKSNGFDFEVELNHYIERKGYGIVEIPIVYRERLGEKKLKIKHGATILRRIVLEAIN